MVGGAHLSSGTSKAEPSKPIAPWQAVRMAFISAIHLAIPARVTDAGPRTCALPPRPSPIGRVSGQHSAGRQYAKEALMPWEAAGEGLVARASARHTTWRLLILCRYARFRHEGESDAVAQRAIRSILRSHVARKRGENGARSHEIRGKTDANAKVLMSSRRLAALSAQLAARPALAADESTLQEIAIIVGGGPGISGACARLFASEGMVVAIAQRSPEKPAIKSIIDASPGKVFAYQCDAADAGSVGELFETVKAAHEGVIRCVVFSKSQHPDNPSGSATCDSRSIYETVIACVHTDPSARVGGPVVDIDPEGVKEALLVTAYGGFVSKNDEFWIKKEKLCIKNEEFCI